jgi:signal transduction histidine kinase
VSDGSSEADRRHRLRHDLRSPLTIITGFAELLASDKPIAEDTRREYAARIQAAGVDLRTLLDEWLDETT